MWCMNDCIVLGVVLGRTRIVKLMYPEGVVLHQGDKAVAVCGTILWDHLSRQYRTIRYSPHLA